MSGTCAEVHKSKTHTHRGHPVKVGDHTIWAGGIIFLEPEDVKQFDVVIGLARLRDPQQLKRDLKQGAELVQYELEDFGGVPEDWGSFLGRVVEYLRQEKRVLVFCGAGQGRTGTLLASLVALLEPDVHDPVRAVRERYCPHAVETSAQARAVFAIRGQKLPMSYGVLTQIPAGIIMGEAEFVAHVIKEVAK